MPFDTLASVVGKVQQRVGTLPDYLLLEDAIVNKYRVLQRYTNWTWRRKQAEFYCYAPITTGTVTVTRGNNVATFSSGVLSAAVIGRQLRINGTNGPIRTIIGMTDSTHGVLDRAWSYIDQTAVGYEIYSAYYTVPDDFSAFLTITDLQRGFQLNWWSYSAEALDRVDARRSYAGNIAYCVVLKDYSSDRRGIVNSVVQVRGTGNAPISGGEFTGPADALFTVEITGSTAFKWKKDSGVYTTGVTIDATGAPQQLQDGVLVTFPAVTYTTGDVFVVRCQAADAPGSPRYEMWPHVKADETRPYLYLANLPDLTDPGAVLPRFVPGEILMEMVLGDIARWKNPANGYYDLKLAGIHDGRVELMLIDMLREDQARENSDLTYNNWMDLPAYDSEFFAGHDVGFEIDTLY